MDEIQKILVKAGRRDLAQKYYKKISQRKFKDKTEFESEVKDFVKNVQSKSKIVKLKLDRVEFKEFKKQSIFYTFTFDIIFDINDPYIDKKTYLSGDAYIYLSDRFYTDIENIAKRMFNTDIEWNNTKKTGTISGFVTL